MSAKQTKHTTHEVKAKAAPAATPSPNQGTLSTIPYWLLKDGHCKKLGKRSEGGIKYQLLASDDRAVLYVRITANDSGGYFSKELVPFSEIEQCLEKCADASSFLSKAFRDAFVGRSTNNAGFLAAILREEGLLEAAQEEEFQHVLAADIAAWKTAALTPQGTQIAIADPNSRAAFAEQSRKTLSVPNKP